MTEFISFLSFSYSYLFNSDNVECILKYLFSISITISFLFKDKLKNNLYQQYIEYCNKYNNCDALPIEIFETIIDKFTVSDYDLFKEELKSVSFIEQVYDFTKTNKKFKIVAKYLEPHINNYKMVKNTQEHYKLQNINSAMLLFSGLGELYYPLKDMKCNELFVYDKNININSLFALNNKISYGINIDKNITTTDVIHDNFINKKVDLIICNIPLDFKNIIYANCCNLIKNLKIRGTKAEPLILQLLMQLINKNGTILLYTSNSLLFGESNQHIETRKYLVNNFNIEKIVDLENKKSLLIIKNNKDFKSIDIIKNNITFSVNKENINTNNYLLDFYKTTNENNTGNSKIKLSDLILIKSKDTNNNYTEKVLYCYKFNNFNIDYINNVTDYNYVFLTKDETIIKQEFLNLCLLIFFNKNLNKITKGKMNNISIDLINDLEIVVLPINTQDLILSQIKLNNVIINNNVIQIQNFIEILNKFITDMVFNNQKEKINNIFIVTNEINEHSLIKIKKNSLSVGTVELIDCIENYKDNTNYFYLNLIDKTKTSNYYYYLLKYYQKDLVENAFKNKSVGISKNFIESMELPILNEEEQNHLIYICEYFYQQIDLLQKNNNLLKETNIISLLI